MFTSNAAAGKSLGKRKMREETTATAEHRFNLPHHLSSSSVPTDGRRSRVQNILNNAAAAPVKPFSYMALLTADDDEEDDYIDEYYHRLPKDTINPSEQINQMIMYHNEKLRQSVARVLEKQERAAEERATKSEVELQEQNAELERLVELYKAEVERLLIRVRYLERTAMSLSEANAARRYAETVEEEAESSFEDPDRVGPVRLDCKVCERQLATVMVWPCRHVCVCKRCDVSTKSCPVCCLVKTTSVEVSIPLD